MKIVAWEELLQSKISPVPSAAAIGVFDGVHVGHLELFSRMKFKHPDYRRIAVTFRDNPKKLMRPESFLGDICNLDQKLELLAAAGLDLCILIDFSPNFSKMSGEDFVRSLVNCGGVRSFIVGWNFAFGHGLRLKAQNLPEVAGHFGACAELVAPVYLADQPVSSTLIRKNLMEGRTDQALAMLGHPYTLDLQEYRIVSTEIEHRASPGTAMGLKLKSGIYLAELLVSGTHVPVRVRVGDDQTLQWHHQNQDVPKAIVFYQRTENTDNWTIV